MLEKILVSFNWIFAVSVGQIESSVQVGHVFSEMEGAVIHVIPDLIVDGGFHLEFSPSGIFGSGKVIVFTDKHGNWYLVDLADFDLRSLPLIVLFNIQSTIVIVIKFATCNKLPVMLELFPRSGLREFRFISCKILVVIPFFVQTLLVNPVTKFGFSTRTELFPTFFKIFSSNFIHVQSFQRLSDRPSIFGNFFETLIGSVTKSDNWGQSDEKVNSFVNPSLVCAECIEHLSRSLRVTHVSHLFNTGYFSYFIDLGGEIVLSELDEAVGKELFLIFFWVKSYMLSGMIITSVVSEPNIVSCVCKFERWRFLWTIGCPTIR